MVDPWHSHGGNVATFFYALYKIYNLNMHALIPPTVHKTINDWRLCGILSTYFLFFIIHLVFKTFLNVWCNGLMIILYAIFNILQFFFQWKSGHVVAESFLLGYELWIYCTYTSVSITGQLCPPVCVLIENKEKLLALYGGTVPLRWRWKDLSCFHC
jgi:hypothetical protein